MNITFPLLLLIIGGLSLWLLTESALKWYFKVACITLFCFFTVIFSMTTHTFLGWPANEDTMPKTVNVHWAIINEPDKLSNTPGRIYLLLQSLEKPKMYAFLRFFGYEGTAVEPRLYGLAYSRSLHERIENEMMPQLRKGQVVRGELTRGTGEEGASGPKGNSKSKSKGKGQGDESQEQEWIFHILRPSQVQPKDPQ